MALDPQACKDLIHRYWDALLWNPNKDGLADTLAKDFTTTSIRNGSQKKEIQDKGSLLIAMDKTHYNTFVVATEIPNDSNNEKIVEVSNGVFKTELTYLARHRFVEGGKLYEAKLTCKGTFTIKEENGVLKIVYLEDHHELEPMNFTPEELVEERKKQAAKDPNIKTFLSDEQRQKV